jgi:hypothetical protein
VVDASRQHDEVAGVAVDADPLLVGRAHVEVARALQEEANLLVAMNVFLGISHCFQ